MEPPHVFQASSDAKPPIPDLAFNRRCSLLASDVSVLLLLVSCCCVAAVLLLSCCCVAVAAIFMCQQIDKKEDDVLQDVAT